MPNHMQHSPKQTSKSSSQKKQPNAPISPDPVNFNSMSAGDILQLQGTIGNTAVLQLLRDRTPDSQHQRITLPSPMLMRKIDPLPKAHVTGSVLNRTKTRAMQQKITEYNKTADTNYDKRQELLMAIQKLAQAWLATHGEDEGDESASAGLVHTKDEVAKREKQASIEHVLEQVIAESAEVAKKRAAPGEGEGAGAVHAGGGMLRDHAELEDEGGESEGPSQTGGAIGHATGAFGVADSVTSNVTGVGVIGNVKGLVSPESAKNAAAQDIVTTFKNMFDGIQNPRAEALAALRESLNTVSGKLLAVAVPGVSFGLAVSGYMDASNSKKALRGSIQSVKDELGLRTADTETLLLGGGDSESYEEGDAEVVPEEEVEMLDLSGEAESSPEEMSKRQELLDSLLYAERKVLRRYYDAIYNIIDTGIGLLTSIATLIVPVASLAKAAIDSGRAAINAIKVVIRKTKGLYKLFTGKRGKHRFETAQQIVEAAQGEDPVALKLIVALDPGGIMWKIKRAVLDTERYQAFPSWPDNPRDMLELIKLMVKYGDLKTLQQMLADKFKSVA